MGMYTSVILDDGTELQFYCGYDNMERYRQGDPVKWEIWPDKPGEGKLLDGIYDATPMYKGRPPGDLVVIKDHKIFFAGKPKGVFDAAQFVVWERSWWTELAWLKKDLSDRKYELQSLMEDKMLLEEEIAFLSSLVESGASEIDIVTKREEFRVNRVKSAISDMVNFSLNRASLTRQVMGVTSSKKRG